MDRQTDGQRDRQTGGKTDRELEAQTICRWYREARCQKLQRSRLDNERARETYRETETDRDRQSLFISAQLRSGYMAVSA